MMRSLLVLILASSPSLLHGQQGEPDSSKPPVQDFPKECCWPEKVHLSKATQVCAVVGTGGVSILLPAGREVRAILSQDHKTLAIYTKDPDLKGTVPIEDTDFLALAFENQNKREKLRLAEQTRILEEAKRQRDQAEAKLAVERAKKRDILVKSWSWGESSSAYFKAVGEIQNESDRDLQSLEVEFITKDSAGNVINTGSALVHDPRLPPSAITTFEVLVRKRGGEETATLAFRRIGIRGERYSYRIQTKD